MKVLTVCALWVFDYVIMMTCGRNEMCSWSWDLAWLGEAVHGFLPEMMQCDIISYGPQYWWCNDSMLGSWMAASTRNEMPSGCHRGGPVSIIDQTLLSQLFRLCIYNFLIELLCQFQKCFIKFRQGSTLKFSGRLSEEPFPWLIQKFPCMDNQVVNSTCPKDKLGWIWRADNP